MPNVETRSIPIPKGMPVGKVTEMKFPKGAEIVMVNKHSDSVKVFCNQDQTETELKKIILIPELEEVQFSYEENERTEQVRGKTKDGHTLVLIEANQE